MITLIDMSNLDVCLHPRWYTLPFFCCECGYLVIQIGPVLIDYQYGDV